MTRPLIALALLGVVAGCANPEGGGALSRFDFWTDEETGCQYVVYWGYNRGGITPRLSPDGTQICERPEGLKEE
jgi:hypothetical protein